MRDTLARIAALALVCLVALLAGFFAYRQNPPGRRAPVEPPAAAVPPAASPAGALDAELVARGRRIYDALSCSRCHRVDGQGNPRSPLDGVGARRPPSRIRAWLTADASVRDQLPRSVVRVKGEFSTLPPEELDALVEYLSSLR